MHCLLQKFRTSSLEQADTSNFHGPQETVVTKKPLNFALIGHIPDFWRVGTFGVEMWIFMQMLYLRKKIKPSSLDHAGTWNFHRL